MSLISAADLASMRSTLNQSLPGTAVISSPSFADDAGGGGTLTWTAAGTVSCRIAPISATSAGTEREIGGRLSAEANYMITLPAETAVAVKNRLTIDSLDYEVLAVHTRSWEISRRVEANRVS